MVHLTPKLMSRPMRETFILLGSLSPGRSRPWIELETVKTARYSDTIAANKQWVKRHLRELEYYRLIECYPGTSFISKITPEFFRLTKTGKRQITEVGNLCQERK